MPQPKLFRHTLSNPLLSIAAAFSLTCLVTLSTSAQTTSHPAQAASSQAALPDAPSPANDSTILRRKTELLAEAMQPAPDQQPATSTSSSGPDDSTHHLRQRDNAPSLDDLGLSPTQTRPDPDLQARLDLRTHDLKVHQTLGILTLVPLGAACLTSALAPPDPRNSQGGNTTGRDIHVSLGSLSAAMYGATAFYAIKAPRIPGTGPAKGGIKLHKYLIYVHLPGMVLTPILGAMAFNQAADGQKVHGIASAHAAVAWTTVATYTASILAVSWPIHLPWTKQSQTHQSQTRQSQTNQSQAKP
ncbi:MAG TPA: hypothetical protein VGU46_11275 [Acidobacteriaceae bacterium]|nr:hypothetical protein [Acidobacteriaceae bacterium]